MRPSGSSRRRGVDRTAAAVVAAKAARLASRRLGRGGGTALPGLLAERIEPRVVARWPANLAEAQRSSPAPTARPPHHGCWRACSPLPAVPVIHNRSRLQPDARAGSHPHRSSWAERAHPQRGPDGAGVFEVDEATVPPAAAGDPPARYRLDQMFRDQLDRYGEVDSMAALWRRAVRRPAAGHHAGAQRR